MRGCGVQHTCVMQLWWPSIQGKVKKLKSYDVIPDPLVSHRRATTHKIRCGATQLHMPDGATRRFLVAHHKVSNGYLNAL
jgi:hypothetical protein